MLGLYECSVKLRDAEESLERRMTHDANRPKDARERETVRRWSQSEGSYIDEMRKRREMQQNTGFMYKRPGAFKYRQVEVK